MKEIFNNIKRKLEQGDINTAYDRFLKVCNTLYYNKLMDGFIFEKEEIAECLDYFIEINDSEKISKIIELLDKYYNGYVTEIFEGYLKSEKYEMCAKMKKFLK
ncbi:MAG: hypothetical protein HPY57_13420 [Ignavibacteria bacterium]|nr:hypothetical protein [Ignavibacteria bacterium]